jgi:hypothetical protein
MDTPDTQTERIGRRMAKILVEQLKPGMKLARPLLNASGMVLMAEGTELTEARISKIENMGVDSVYVDGLSKPARPKEELLASLDRRFAKVEDKPNMALVKKAVKDHIEAMYE